MSKLLFAGVLVACLYPVVVFGQSSYVGDLSSRYRSASLRLENCKLYRCADYARLKMRFDLVRLEADAYNAFIRFIIGWYMNDLNDRMSRRLFGLPFGKQQRRYTNTIYRLATSGIRRVGEPVSRSCRYSYKLWARCVYRKMDPARLSQLRQQQQLFTEMHKAVPKCPVTYKVFYACRDRIDIRLTKKELAAYDQETGRKQ